MKDTYKLWKELANKHNLSVSEYIGTLQPHERIRIAEEFKKHVVMPNFRNRYDYDKLKKEITIFVKNNKSFKTSQLTNHLFGEHNQSKANLVRNILKELNVNYNFKLRKFVRS